MVMRYPDATPDASRRGEVLVAILTSNGLIPRPFDPERPDGAQQLTLFEAGPEYDLD